MVEGGESIVDVPNIFETSQISNNKRIMLVWAMHTKNL